MRVWLFIFIVISTHVTKVSFAVDDNPYKLLDVPTTATESEIKKAYRAKALAHHPDKHSPEEAEKFSKRFMRISAAYDTLMDPRKRRIFDQTQHRQAGKPFDNHHHSNNNHFRSGPPRGSPFGSHHQQYHRPPNPRNVANPTIHNYYSVKDKIMSNFEEKGIWIIHLFTSTPFKCPLCSSFKGHFKQLAIKLSALGFKVGAMNCAKDMLKCRRHEALYNRGIPLEVSETQFVPSLTVVLREEGQTETVTTTSFKVSGSPYVCMTNSDCSGNSNKHIGNAAGLYSSIFYKLQSMQVSSITQWSELRDFMTRHVSTPAKPNAAKFNLLLWSARTEIDKTLVNQFISVAHSLNVTLGTIRNALTTNKPFVNLFHLKGNTDSRSNRDTFPLLLMQCHAYTDNLLFTAHQQYPHSLTSPDSMEKVALFLKDFIENEGCQKIIEEAQLRQEAAASIARVALKSVSSIEELRQMRVTELRDLARDLFGGDLDHVSGGDRVGNCSNDSGLSRAALLGLGEVGEGGTRLVIDKADIISALLEVEAVASSSDTAAAETFTYSACEEASICADRDTKSCFYSYHADSDLRNF